MKSDIELYNEGYRYYTGADMYPLNREKAFECFLASANLGNCEAMNYIAIMYQKGHGVRADFAEAVNWYKRAADAGSAYAMVSIAVLYMNGNGVPKDESKAYEYYERAYAKNKHPRAAYVLGCRHMEAKEYLEGARLFKHAAEQGKIPEAWYNLGVLIANHGIRMNNADPKLQASMAYKSAAELGLVEAMHAYAMVVVSIAGGVNKEAMTWLNKAAEKGYEPSKKFLKMHRFSKSGSIFDLFG